MPRCFVVQVDLEESDPIRAKLLGEYRCNFLVKHPSDAKVKPQCDFRYWPEVRELREYGSGGSRHSVSPWKAQGYIDKHPALFRFSDTISIAKDQLAGPFNYVTLNESNKPVRHRVPEEAWIELEENATRRGLNVQSMRRVANNT